MACKQKCPVDAIEIVKDNNGFEYPQITEKCIKCGGCVNVCHVMKEIIPNYYRKSYLAILKDKRKRMLSSSGGIFFAVASWTIIEKQGIVYGARICNGIYVEHYRATSLEEVNMLQGSKYVQSSIRNTYKEVLADLIKGKWVLYSGTPCQISGLKCFLGVDYDNLVTIDLVCKGVCSSELIKKEIEYVTSSRNVSNVKNLSFRQKRWNHKTIFALAFSLDDKYYELPYDESIYYSSFIKELSYRESCYFCKYANISRVSDITIGDCNIADKYYKFHTGEAVSLMILNTMKAEKIISDNLNNIDIMSFNLEEEIKNNRPLHKCSDKYKERMDFLEGLNNKSWASLTAEFVCKKNTFAKIKDVVKDMLPKYLKSYVKGVVGSGYDRK